MVEAREGKPERPQEKLDLSHLKRLRRLLETDKFELQRLRGDDLLELMRLYRHASSLVARLESTGQAPRGTAEARALVGRAHSVLFRRHRTGASSFLADAWHFVMAECPRALRAEWRLLALTFGFVYGLAILAFVAVSRDLDLASSLLDGGVVADTIRQLEETPAGEPFRGNFTFGFGESPHTAGWIMVHNMSVGILIFASALVPPLYLLILSQNSLMLGTYTAVAGHWDQAGSISSILWCHGVLEIQALLLAGSAGLVLVRAWIRPGRWTRRYALQVESRRALRLLTPVFPLLFIAGMIEGFVSPHAPANVRLATAIATGVALSAWALLGGRKT